MPTWNDSGRWACALGWCFYFCSSLTSSARRKAGAPAKKWGSVSDRTGPSAHRARRTYKPVMCSAFFFLPFPLLKSPCAMDGARRLFFFFSLLFFLCLYLYFYYIYFFVILCFLLLFYRLWQRLSAEGCLCSPITINSFYICFLFIIFMKYY